MSRSATTPLIRMENIHKKFPGVHALRGVEFELLPGEVHALMGENGAGKSTLIKIIAGVYAGEGTYRLDGSAAEIHQPLDAIRKGISVIYQELNLVPEMSVAENIFFGRLPAVRGRVLWNVLYGKTEEYLAEVGLSIDPRKKVRYLSVAQQQLVEIAKSLSLNARSLIMDEPTSALCSGEILNLFELIRRLKAKGAGIVYISHKLEEVFTIADRVTVLRDGEYIGTQAIGDLTPDRLISMMVGRQRSELLPKTPVQAGEVVLEVRNLSTEKVRGASFQARQGEIIGFSGLMGSGRTELTYALMGLDARKSGTITLDGAPVPRDNPVKAREMGMGLVPEDRKLDGIFPDLSVKENMSIVSLREISTLRGIRAGREQEKVAGMIGRLAIKTPSMKQIIANLSGGNQQKVIVARWLMKSGLKCLIIDEPTRGIDVGSKAEIYRILDELAHQGMAILMMSSEMPEILGMCDRIYVMAAGEIRGEFQRGQVTQEKLLASCIDH